MDLSCWNVLSYPHHHHPYFSGMLCLNTVGLQLSPAGSCQPHLFIQNSCRPNMTNCFCRTGKRCRVFTNNTFLPDLSSFNKVFVINLFSPVWFYVAEPSASNFCVFPDLTLHWWKLSHRSDMGTQGSGRKRAPLKDRFSAEDEALSSIAREVSLATTIIVLGLNCNQFSDAWFCLAVFF